MPLSFDLVSLRKLYTQRQATPGEIAREVIDRIAERGDDNVWITRVPNDRVLASAAALEQRAAAEGIDALPLYGIPFAVKDNINVAGWPTTVACHEAAYVPPNSAPAVERLLRAGALFVGKTNLDQFATGLVGTRSPYGVPRNPFDAAYIPGGSSSGSAVAVATGLVSFALGTDTAGSGRVPAAFNNIVGLKPSRGVISTRGVVPACASLDCVSIFALTVTDAATVLAVAREAAPEREALGPAMDHRLAGFVFGAPYDAQREFFGELAAPAVFDGAIRRLAGLGGSPLPIDLAPFVEAGALLYGPGPWLAERRDAVDAATGGRRAVLHPVTRRVIEAGDAISAADIRGARRRLAALVQQIGPLWREIDLLIVPTAGRIYRIDEVAADPIGANASLGRYTSFANLLDLAAVAVPAGFLPTGLPMGVTLLVPSGNDALLASIGAAFTEDGGEPGVAGLTAGSAGDAGLGLASVVER
jgi:allophanate hydrolase